jgi:hypothetical protein
MENVESKGFESFIPENAKEFVDGALKWIRDNPTEAALIGAGAGLVVGLTGFGRLYQGVKTVRSMPVVSQLLVGVVAKGLLAKAGPDADSVH